MRWIFFFLFFLSTTNLSAIAQHPANVSPHKKATTLKLDSGRLDLKKFDEKSVAGYRKQKAFIYDDVAPPTLSWWDRFWNWFWHLFDGRSQKNALPFIKYIAIALSIAALVFIVFKLVGVDFKLFTGKSKPISVPYEENLENIHEIDFDDQIDKALQNANYRLVIRLLYLKTLKQLSDRQLIDWRPEKTNQTYVLELQGDQYKDSFAALTQQFEYIWYGDFHIDHHTFQPIFQSFQQFNQKTK